MEGIDRISELPDEILGHILSYLCISTAVTTSILSTRWRNLYPSAISFRKKIDLSDFSVEFPGPNATWRTPFPSFINFLDKLLKGRLRDVESISLHSEKTYDDAKVLSWFSSVVQLNVQRLSFHTSLDDSGPLFATLNGCAALVDLYLGGGFKLYLPKGFILPNLKILCLGWISFLDGGSIRKLLAGCAKLEELSLYHCNFYAVTLRMESCLLKKLKLLNCINEVGCKVVIDAPNLEYFIFIGYDVPKYVKKFEMPLSACIDFCRMDEIYYGDDLFNHKRRVAKLVRVFLSTNRLCLSGHSLMVLHRSSVKLPTFGNLTCLAIGLVETEGWSVLAHLLQSAPKLEVLFLEKGFERHGLFESRCYARFESSLRRLPVCLKLHLKKIEMWKIRGEEDEIQLVGYLLKNGAVLEEVVIRHLPRRDMSALNGLFILPRLSQKCQIIFLHESEKWGSPSADWGHE